MIPKVIHYCWFGRKPLPQSALKCIDSWKRYLPGYQIIRWDEDNFDVDIVPYTSEAYSVGKYAFVSDYARFWVLYKYGGLYFDVDVELIAGIDDIIRRGNFMGYEAGMSVAPGLGLGLEPQSDIAGRLLDEYLTTHFLVDGKMMISRTVVNIATEIMSESGVVNVMPGVDRIKDVFVYYPEYFSPLNHKTGVLTLTRNSRSIHHYDASWKTSAQKTKDRLVRFLGPELTSVLVKFKKFLIRYV